jgi:hypothetical protein
MDRAVPRIIFSACSMLLALRSGIFFSAISRICAAEILPTFVVSGLPEPFCRPMAFIIRFEAGGVLRMNSNERSSKIVISTGIMRSPICPVRSLNCLTKSAMFSPCGPSAVPTGGAAVAFPAGSCNFTIAFTFFAMRVSSKPS